MTFSVVDQLFPRKKKKARFFSGQKFIWVIGLQLVFKKVAFWAFFEKVLLITLELHVGHTKFPDFHTLS